MYTKTKKMKMLIEGLWSMRDLVQRFGMTNMAIINWINDKGLPVITLPGGKRAFCFVPDDVRTWAEKNGKTLHEYKKRKIKRINA